MFYSIYHPTGGRMNHDCTPAQYMYERVFSLKAESFAEAFKLCQNDFNPDYASMGYRSTSVGDVIQSHEDWLNNEYHVVTGTGFQTVSNAWIRFIDWGEPDLATLADQQDEMLRAQ